MENDRMPVVGFVYNRKKTATRSKAAGWSRKEDNTV